MTTFRKLLLAAFVAGTAGLAGTAHAAVATRITTPTVTQSPATMVHWEWRHHRRYWVEDRRRRDYRHYDHR